jgi:hypothetical protein
MRESCVSLALKQHLAAQRGAPLAGTPLVLLVITSAQEHQAATLSIGYRRVPLPQWPRPERARARPPGCAVCCLAGTDWRFGAHSERGCARPPPLFGGRRRGRGLCAASRLAEAGAPRPPPRRRAFLTHYDEPNRMPVFEALELKVGAAAGGCVRALAICASHGLPCAAPLCTRARSGRLRAAGGRRLRAAATCWRLRWAPQPRCGPAGGPRQPAPPPPGSRRPDAASGSAITQAVEAPPLPRTQALNMGRSLGFTAYQQYSPLLMPQVLDSAAAAAGSAAPEAAQQQAGSSGGVPAAAQVEDLAARVGLLGRCSLGCAPVHALLCSRTRLQQS